MSCGGDVVVNVGDGGDVSGGDVSWSLFSGSSKVASGSGVGGGVAAAAPTCFLVLDFFFLLDWGFFLFPGMS